MFSEDRQSERTAKKKNGGVKKDVITIRRRRGSGTRAGSIILRISIRCWKADSLHLSVLITEWGQRRFQQFPPDGTLLWQQAAVCLRLTSLPVECRRLTTS